MLALPLCPLVIALCALSGLARSEPSSVSQNDKSVPKETVSPAAQARAEEQREAEALAAFELLKKERDAKLIHYNYILPGRRTPRKRREAFEKFYPKPKIWGPKFADVAEQYPGTKGAGHSLVWIVRNLESSPLEAKSRATLLDAHMHRPMIANICKPMGTGKRPGATRDLERILKNAPGAQVQAAALKELIELDLAALRETDLENLRERVTARLHAFETQFAKLSLEGKEGSFWIQRFKRDLEFLSLGQKMLAWEGIDLAGKSHGIGDYRDKVCLLFFWRSTPHHGRKVVPNLKALQGQTRGKPLQILGFSGDPDKKRAKRWMETLGLDFPNWSTPTPVGKPNPFGVETWPSFIVLDRGGRILSAGASYPEARKAVLFALEQIEKRDPVVPPRHTDGE